MEIDERIDGANRHCWQKETKIYVFEKARPFHQTIPDLQHQTAAPESKVGKSQQIKAPLERLASPQQGGFTVKKNREITDRDQRRDGRKKGQPR
ncbi:MAG: hypothetical protein P4N60_08395 [Verrucomicrobiae bacterium]|nr:hypothetical protein [Verrucomicrobiae bacterium]